MATDRILRNSGRVFEVTFYVDGTGTPADAAVTYLTTKADGTTLTSGTATAIGGGVYRFTLAPQANLNLLKTVWTGAFTGVTQSVTTYAEIVGAHLVTEVQVRAFDGAAMASPTTYPDADIADARARVTDLLEFHTGVSWIPRFRRLVMDGDATTSLYLPNPQVTTVLTLSNSSTLLTSPQLAELKLYESGEVYWSGGSFVNDRSSVIIEYEHGYTFPRDGVDRIALMWIRAELVRSNISERALSVSDETGTLRLSIPTEQRPSGLPLVDAWIAAHDQRLKVA